MTSPTPPTEPDPTLGGLLGPRPATPAPGVYDPDQGSGAADYQSLPDGAVPVRQIERLTFAPGDALIVRSTHDLSDEVADQLTGALAMSFPGVSVVIVDDITDLQTLSPEQMREAGWAPAADLDASEAEQTRLREELASHLIDGCTVGGQQ